MESWTVNIGCRSMEKFDTTQDELQIGGMPLTRLAERVGETPFYAYDRRLIAARVAQVRRALPAGVQLHYALKANPMPALAGFLQPLVDGMDVASAGELRIALNAGVQPQNIGFAGPGKRPSELRQAVAAGALLHVESAHELGALAQAAQAVGCAARVALRINPDWELRGAGMHMGGGAKPFGIDAEQVPAVLRSLQGYGVCFEGFHVYPGSQTLRGEVIAESLRRSLQLVLQLAQEAPSPVRHVNLGGGWGIPYFPGDKPLSLLAVSEELARVQQAMGKEMPGASLVLELGRYLVGEAGIYVARVTERKVSRGKVFLVTDGGMHHHLAASGNFGQVIRRNFPVAIGNRMNAQKQETASVVGPLCTPLDILAEQVSMAEACQGDLVVVFQSGAYGATASPQAFLGHPPCVEVLV